MKNLGDEEKRFAIYTCIPMTLTLVITKKSFIVIDTHKVPHKAGGNGNGLIRIMKENESSKCELVKDLLEWMELRMKHAIKDWDTCFHSLIQIVDKLEFLADDDDDILNAVLNLEDTNVEQIELADDDDDTIPTSINREDTNLDNDTSSLWCEANDDILNIDEKEELLWKGHLTQFGLSKLKCFQLKHAIAAIEKKRCHCCTANWKWEKYVLSTSIHF